jgi:hypothetical protein
LYYFSANTLNGWHNLQPVPGNAAHFANSLNNPAGIGATVAFSSLPESI